METHTHLPLLAEPKFDDFIFTDFIDQLQDADLERSNSISTDVSQGVHYNDTFFQPLNNENDFLQKEKFVRELESKSYKNENCNTATLITENY